MSINNHEIISSQGFFSPQTLLLEKSSIFWEKILLILALAKVLQLFKDVWWPSSFI